MDAYELDAIFGPLPPRPRVPPVRPLDELLASRTHVRVLRVLAWAPERNLTARDVARWAGSSHSRVLEVIHDLVKHGIVRMDWTPTHSLVRLDTRHLLIAAVTDLFETEQRLVNVIVSQQRAEPLERPS